MTMSDAVMTADAGTLVAAWIAAFDGADLGPVLPWCRPDVIVHAPAAHAGAPEGLGRIALLLDIYRRAFPDGRFEIERSERAGALVSCAWIARGVNSGPFLHLPITHREVVVRGTCRLRIAEGSVAEVWFTFGFYELLEQLDGLLPAPGRVLAPAAAAARRAVGAWTDAVSGGPKALDGAFSPDVVVHADCFGLQLVERGLPALDKVLALVQSMVGDVRVTIREHAGQGRTATYRARLAGQMGGADRQWALDCMLRADGDHVLELWLRVEEMRGDVD
jgi:hypothetical protein